MRDGEGCCGRECRVRERGMRRERSVRGGLIVRERRDEKEGRGVWKSED